MKVLIALLLSAACFSASAEPATEASIDEMLNVTHAAQTMDMIKDSMQKGMQAGFTQATQGKKLSTSQVAYLNGVTAKFRVTLDQQMQWSDIRPLVIQVYEENFTEKEVRAAIAFYTSPEGSAFITKMPAVNQRAQELMVQHFAPMGQKMQEQMASAIQQVQTIQ